MLRMSDTESSATAQQVPKRLLRWRAHSCSKATQWQEINRHGIKSPRHSSKACLDTNTLISSICFPSSIQFFKNISAQSIIITVAYQFLKLIRIWLQWELTVFFNKHKEKYLGEFSIFPSFSFLCGIPIVIILQEQPQLWHYTWLTWRNSWFWQYWSEHPRTIKLLGLPLKAIIAV